MGSKSSPAPPPNYAPIAQAQMQSATMSNQLAQQQLDWAKQAWAADQARAAGQQATLDQLVAEARDRQEKLDAQAAADRARYEAVFRPLEDSLVRESQQYTPELIAGRAEAAAGRAAADISSQFAVARSAAQDRLESYGIDPSQTRAGALDLSTRVSEAAARAGAANMQRDATLAREQQYGAQLRAQALALGQGMPGQVLNAYAAGLGNQQAAAGLGQQGLGNFLSSNQLGGQLMGSPTQYGALANQGLAGAADTLNTGYKNYLDYYKTNQSQSSGWGTALGLIGGIGLSAAMPGIQTGIAPIVSNWFKPLQPRAYAEGGAVNDTPSDVPHSGVPVTPDMAPPGAPPVDGVPAALNVGEFIVPTDVVKWKGEEFFQKLIQKSREAKGEAPAKPRMAAVPMGPPTVSTVPQPPLPSPTEIRPAMADGGVVPMGRVEDRRRPFYPYMATDRIRDMPTWTMGVPNASTDLGTFQRVQDEDYMDELVGGDQPPVFSGPVPADLQMAVRDALDPAKAPFYPRDQLATERLNARRALPLR